MGRPELDTELGGPSSFGHSGGFVLKEWSIEAPKGRGLTVAEIQEALDGAPPGLEPQVVVSWGGKIKKIRIKGELKP